MAPPGDWLSPPGGDDDVLGHLRLGLAREGLHIVLPLDAEDFDRELVALRGPSLASLLVGACGAFIVGDGGPTFFARFRQAQAVAGAATTANPLDDYTRVRVTGAVEDALAGAGVRHRIVYPFDGGGAEPDSRPLPFQRLGRAAGLPAAGPLGIQVHPHFGPWWAYRALVIVAGPSRSITCEPALLSPCEGCAAPCASACPGHAVAAAAEFAVVRCASHRQVATACFGSCAARLACPAGATQRYPGEQLAFHMKASMVQIRAFATAPSVPRHS